MGAGSPDVAVGPFALQDADERFGFAVGLRVAWACAEMFQSGRAGRVGKGARDVAVAVVGEHSLWLDAALRQPAEMLIECSDARLRAFAGQQHGVRETAVVIDHDVQVLPTGVPVAIADVGAERAFARLPETPEAFDVEMDQASGLGVLVATDISTGLRRTTRDTGAFEHARQIVDGGRPSTAASRAGPQPVRARSSRICRSASADNRHGQVLRDRRTIAQTVPPSDSIATQQPIRRRATSTAQTRRIRRRHPIEHQPHQPTARFPRVAHPPWRSTLRHPGLREIEESQQPQDSREARTPSTVSQAHRSYS